MAARDNIIMAVAALRRTYMAAPRTMSCLGCFVAPFVAVFLLGCFIGLPGAIIKSMLDSPPPPAPTVITDTDTTP